MGYSYEQELRELQDEHERIICETGYETARLSAESDDRLERIRELKRLIAEGEQ